MPEISIFQVLTYFSYIFIIAVYTWRTIKYARMPVHLRWELYPLPREKGKEYGGSYFEEINWWQKPRERNLMRDIIFMIKDYLYFMQYYSRNRSYWFSLYPLHVGFYLIVGFHILAFFGGLSLLLGIPITSASPNPIGLILYFVMLIAGVGSFTIGAVGSIALLIKRATDRDLKLFTPAQYYFNYLFFLVVFLTGLYAWYFTDPTFTDYREFWKSLITLKPVHIAPSEALHITLFSLFLIYLPFTRAMHYITKFFAFFSIRWDDQPNVRGSELEKKIGVLVNQKVTWSAPHIGSGKTWVEAVTQKEINEKEVK